MKEICFTDHMEYILNSETQPWAFDWNTYSDTYDELTVSELKIRRGMEFGLKPYNLEDIRRDTSRRQFDFVIGSVHCVKEQDVYYPEFWEEKTLEDAYRMFLEETLTCVQAHSDFDVLGHLTFICKSPKNPTCAPLYYRDYREIVDEILKELVRKGKGMEINTSGRDVCGVFLPAEEYFRRFKELGGEIVTIGSDAHDERRVGQYADEACEMLRDIFGHVCTFEDRKPIFHKL
ncbi:MAG: hypothetical protein IJ955_00420 [Oscillospiraceae bacterium]|nr:hypothetical protein [Oscillospiraceae bacterium]